MKKLIILVLALLALVLCGEISYSAQVTLAWDPPIISTDVTGYKIHYGTEASGNYSTTVDVGNVTTFSINNLTDGAVYYFAVTAYNNSLESENSNEVTFGKGVAMGSILIDSRGMAKIVFTDSMGAIVSTKNISYTYGVWKPLNISLAPNGNGSILWDNSQGTAIVWYIDSAGNKTGYSSIPYILPYRPVYHSLNADGTASLVYDNRSGMIKVDFLTPQVAVSSHIQYPYTLGTWKLLSYSSSLLGPGLYTWDNMLSTVVTWDSDSIGTKTTYDIYDGYNKLYWIPLNGCINGDLGKNIAWKSTAGNSLVVWFELPDGTYYMPHRYLNLNLTSAMQGLISPFIVNYDGR